jgi:hypothetical protein
MLGREMINGALPGALRGGDKEISTTVQRESLLLATTVF